MRPVIRSFKGTLYCHMVELFFAPLVCVAVPRVCSRMERHAVPQDGGTIVSEKTRGPSTRGFTF